MTTQCCEKCRCPEDCDQPGEHCLLIKNGKPACKCHQTHTTKEGWKERFDDLGITFTSDINRSICKQFIASEITKAQVEVIEYIESEKDSGRGVSVSDLRNKFITNQSGE